MTDDRLFRLYFNDHDLTMSHRLRRMGTRDGIDYIDDRQEEPPTVNSVWYALASMYQRTVWVTQWASGHLDEIHEVVASTCKSIVVIGDPVKFHRAFPGMIIATATDFSQAEDLARRMARPGDAILFT